MPNIYDPQIAALVDQLPAGTMTAHALKSDWLASFAAQMEDEAPAIDPDDCCDLENPESCEACQ